MEEASWRGARIWRPDEGLGQADLSRSCPAGGGAVPAPAGGAGRLPQARRGWCREKAHQAVEGGDRRQQGWWALLLLCHPQALTSSSSSPALHFSSSEPQPGGTVLSSHSQPRAQPELCRHAGAAGAVLHEPQGDGRGQPAQGKWAHWKEGGGTGLVLLAPAARLVWSLLAFSLRTLALAMICEL